MSLKNSVIPFSYTALREYKSSKLTRIIVYLYKYKFLEITGYSVSDKCLYKLPRLGIEISVCILNYNPVKFVNAKVLELTGKICVAEVDIRIRAGEYDITLPRSPSTYLISSSVRNTASTIYPSSVLLTKKGVDLAK